MLLFCSTAIAFNSALAIELVSTNSGGQQSPSTNGSQLASAISNDGNTILFRSFDTTLIPGSGLQNFYIKTLNDGRLIEIIRRLDGRPLEQGGNHFASMDEPPTRVVFSTRESNILPNTAVRLRIYSTAIGSYVFQPIRGIADDPEILGFTDFAANSRLDRVYMEIGMRGDLGQETSQIVEVNAAVATPAKILTVRPDGRPSQLLGTFALPGYWPSISVSGDGRWVTWQGDQLDVDPVGFGNTIFSNEARNLFIRDTQTGVTKKVLADNGRNLYWPTFQRVADDGSFVAFNMDGYFTPPCGDAKSDNGLGIVGFDTRTGRRECISLNDAGEPGNGFYARLDVSGDGSRVVFSSTSTNLSSVTQNPIYFGLYVRDRRLNRTVRIDISDSGVPGNRRALLPRISRNGRWVVFTSDSSNLIPNDSNGHQYDLYRVDLYRFLPDPNVIQQRISVPIFSPVGFSILLFGVLVIVWWKRLAVHG